MIAVVTHSLSLFARFGFCIRVHEFGFHHFTLSRIVSLCPAMLSFVGTAGSNGWLVAWSASVLVCLTLKRHRGREVWSSPITHLAFLMKPTRAVTDFIFQNLPLPGTKPCTPNLPVIRVGPARPTDCDDPFGGHGHAGPGARCRDRCDKSGATSGPSRVRAQVGAERRGAHTRAALTLGRLSLISAMEP